MRDLASCPNIAVKVSVGIDTLTAWKTWSPPQLKSYVDAVTEDFGAARMMLASNWPIIQMRRGYAQAWMDLAGLVADTGMTSDQIAEVKGGTAVRWYGLDTAER